MYRPCICLIPSTIKTKAKTKTCRDKKIKLPSGSSYFKTFQQSHLSKPCSSTVSSLHSMRCPCYFRVTLTITSPSLYPRDICLQRMNNSLLSSHSQLLLSPSHSDCSWLIFTLQTSSLYWFLVFTRDSQEASHGFLWIEPLSSFPKYYTWKII
jgi:hypothetical protein